MNHSGNKGFTLIEIAGVMVCIGFLLGGIFVGRDLIRAAEIRATGNQIAMLDQAFYAFRLKYNCLPGDCSDPASLGFNPAVVVASNGLPLEPSGFDLLNPVSSAYAFDQNSLLSLFGDASEATPRNGMGGGLVQSVNILDTPSLAYVASELFQNYGADHGVTSSISPTGQVTYQLPNKVGIQDNAIDPLESFSALQQMADVGMIPRLNNGLLILPGSRKSSGGSEGITVPGTFIADPDNFSLLPAGATGGYYWLTSLNGSDVLPVWLISAYDMKYDDGDPGAPPKWQIMASSSVNGNMRSGAEFNPLTDVGPDKGIIQDPITGEYKYNNSKPDIRLTALVKSAAF